MENKVKQTALQWLNDELNKKYGIELSADSEVFNKALQMERDQIEEAYKCGKIPAMFSFNTPTANEYYTDTYGE